MSNLYTKREKKILGVGLSCLDIIDNDNSIEYYNGGSCGNVISALSFLGFNSEIITRPFHDAAGGLFDQNLKMLGVKKIEVGTKATLAPRIIEHLYHSEGEYLGHKFLLRCPECTKELPKLKLFSSSDVQPLINCEFTYDALYADRVSTGISFLVNYFNSKGSWTIYEPNSCRNLNAFYKNAAQSKVLKFSAEKVPDSVADNFKKSTFSKNVLLIIQTRGKDGLRFCYRKKDKLLSSWISLPAQPILNLVDTTGAGDWCTAGMISCLLNMYKKCPKWLTKVNVISALQYGQALSAVACSFVGGLGLIYAKDSEHLLNKIFTKSHLKELKNIHPAVPNKSKPNMCHFCLQDH